MNNKEAERVVSDIGSRCNNEEEIIHGIFEYSFHEHKDRDSFLQLLKVENTRIKNAKVS